MMPSENITTSASSPTQTGVNKGAAAALPASGKGGEGSEEKNVSILRRCLYTVVEL